MQPGFASVGRKRYYFETSDMDGLSVSTWMVYIRDIDFETMAFNLSGKVLCRGMKSTAAQRSVNSHLCRRIPVLLLGSRSQWKTGAGRALSAHL